MFGVPTKVAKQVCEKILGAKVEKTFARWLLVRSHKGRKISGDELLTFINTISQEDLKVLQETYKDEIGWTVSNTTMLLAVPVGMPFLCLGTQLWGWFMANDVFFYTLSGFGDPMICALGTATGILPVVGIAAFAVCNLGCIVPPIAYPFAAVYNAYRRYKLLW